MALLYIVLFQLVTLITAGDLVTDRGSYEKTLIGLEIMPNFFKEIFLVGGFTGGNESRCSGSADKNPCSIPSHHIFPKSAPTSYRNWASGDNFLNMEGAEPDQGTHKGKLAYGTPLWNMDYEAVKNLLHLSHPQERMEYWVVELELDCSKTNGYFEVEAVVETKSERYMYETRNEFLQKGKPPLKQKLTKPPMAKLFPLDDHGSQDDLTGHSHKWDKPGHGGKREGIEVTPIKNTNSGPFARGCRGSVPIQFPYQTSRHLGLCGKANIFRYKSKFCEIHEL